MTRIQAMWATLIRAVGPRLSRIPVVVREARRVLVWLIVTLIGRWQWQAPAWLKWLETQRAGGWRYLAANPKRAALLALVVVSTGGGYFWYASRPKPHYVTYAVGSPALTEYNDNGIASIKAMKVVFSESAAPLKQLQKAVTTGIDVSPSIAGTWFWTNDKELQFTPKD